MATRRPAKRSGHTPTASTAALPRTDLHVYRSPVAGPLLLHIPTSRLSGVSEGVADYLEGRPGTEKAALAELAQIGLAEPTPEPMLPGSPPVYAPVLGRLRHPRAAGFTVVELLVVIVICTILAGLVVAGYQAARAKGRQSACASNLRQIGAALRMYMSDWNGFLPPYICGDHGTAGCAPYVAAVSPFIKSREVWFCPSDPFIGQDTLLDDWRVDHRYTSYQALYSEQGYGGKHINHFGVWLARDGWALAHSGGSNIVRFDGSVKWMDPIARGIAEAPATRGSEDEDR